MIIVKDDILPNRLRKELYNVCTHPETSWLFSSGTHGYEGMILRDNEVEEHQYTHVAYYNNTASELWPLLLATLYFLEKELNVEITEIKRCKVNALSHTKNYDKDKNHPVHPDVTESGWHSAIYYVTGSNGNTVFTDKTYPDLKNINSTYKIVKEVEPVQGRFVIFPSNIYHASSPTTDERRIAINYVFKTRDGVL
jgi:hypothetical protein